jgi:hypothetical protein
MLSACWPLAGHTVSKSKETVTKPQVHTALKSNAGPRVLILSQLNGKKYNIIDNKEGLEVRTVKLHIYASVVPNIKL